ncbi:MAG: cytochrome P450 [Pseudomonadota bacterium]
MQPAVTLMSPEEMADPSISAERLLNGPRCTHFTSFDPPFYIVSRYADISDLLRRPHDFLSGHGQGPNFAPAAGVVSDPPTHTFYRKLVQGDFLPGTISSLRARMYSLAETMLDQVADQPAWDIHDALAFPLPVTIICDILGIPTDDIEQFKLWSDAIGAALSAQDPTPYEAEQQRMREYLVALLHERRSTDDDRLLARIARAEQHGVQLTDDEAVGLILQLFVAGNETTTSLITNFVWRMLANGLWQEFCAGNLETQQAITESLRFDPPLLGLFRTTARDLQIGDTPIPANTKILLHYGAGNRDPAVFTQPHVFDVNRPRKNILSFGLGIHVCLGRELARLEAQAALEVLARRFPNLQLEGDGERVAPFLFWGRHKLPVRHTG